ncbi:MAG: biopolymer transporter ExbD [Kiritimatiellae bacterium]|jgi:biopolymer transport protein ExbD|nr:biopolymer transporter ExbD [Kiritimatiellia bacterium]
MKKYLSIVAILIIAGCASTKTDVVQIDASGGTKLNGRPIPVNEISEHIRGETVLIRANKATQHENVVAVMQEAKDAGIKNVSLATSEADTE